MTVPPNSANVSPQPAPPTPVQRKRHGCLTTWLIVMVVLNVLAILLISGILMVVEAPGWLVGVSVGSGILSIIFIIGVFMWKKWGAYGIIVIYTITIVLNVISLSFTSIAGSVIGLSVFLWVLNMGGENKAWNYLE